MQLPWPFLNRRAEMTALPFPDEWTGYLDTNVKHYAYLTPEEQAALRGDLRIFMDDKFWEGAGGFVVTTEVKVTISALVSLLTVGFPRHDGFPNVETVLVYPDPFVTRTYSVDHLSVVDEARVPVLGEAHMSGPVVLSWPDVLSGGRSELDGENLVFHEFAHKLDFRDHSADGVPYLRDRREIDAWAKTMQAAFERLLDDLASHRHSLLGSYAATNAAEFFAVCTERFFEKPEKLREYDPDLYGVLRDYYGIDWAERLARST